MAPLKQKKAPKRPDIPKVPIPGYQLKCHVEGCKFIRRHKALFAKHVSKEHLRDEEDAAEGNFFINSLDKDILIWGAKLRRDDEEERYTGVLVSAKKEKSSKTAADVNNESQENEQNRVWSPLR